jgi:hypothetical protein
LPIWKWVLEVHQSKYYIKLNKCVLQQTCDLEKGIKVFDYASNAINPGPSYPVVTQTKKVVPTFSVGNAKQFTLWDDETKKGVNTPGPVSYDQNDKIIKMNKHQGTRAMGFDVKSNAKRIKITPGPADYMLTNERFKTGIGATSCNRVSQNYKFNNGGLKRPESLSDKEALLLKCFTRSKSDKGINNDLGKIIKGVK